MDTNIEHTILSEFVTNSDLDRLFDWLHEDSKRNVILNNFISERVGHQDVSRFICEHAQFLYTGKIKEPYKLFDNEDLNNVATALGGSSVYSGGKRSNNDYRRLPSFERASGFMSILEQACRKVDKSLAYSSISQLFGHVKDDAAHLLRILTDVITKSEKRSPLVTSSLVSILEHVEGWNIDNAELCAFLESMSKIREEDDSHDVVPASLHAFITKIVANRKSDNDTSSLANIVCSLKQSPFNWIASMCLVHTTSIAGPLDTIPLSEAICAFTLLSCNNSTFPKVYTLETVAFMCLKVAHVLVENSDTDDVYSMGISMCDIAISNLRGYNLNSGQEIENSALIPWQPVEFLTILLDKSHERTEDVSRLLKGILFTLDCGTRDQILRGVLKSCSTDVGLALSIGECKEQSVQWLGCTHFHTEFVKSAIGILKDRLANVENIQEFSCSLSRLLNWLKFLCLCKYRNHYLAFIKRSLIEDVRSKFVSSLEGVVDNQQKLIEMLFEELLQLLER
ncbi:conserved hypothetical protein [Theileria equi strain WA]|uniref:Uncharacterized protein n=1 Tax=Theileria equi strain WA TaxID=1537102 RepID=L1LB05_THEEQ|nr:conserved hypothetical protein [Theileria equi strain WA]EKX72632.1 conserved hypothetical protein [Theileria equi strain WA]|eukprot:XP_004832084.1 conserved hypothetical protein [Theileria equi strain WA]